MKRFGVWFLVIAFAFLSVTAFAAEEELSESEKERKAKVEKFDREKLRGKTDFVIDRSEKFLIEPEEKSAGEFTVANIPPEVKLRIFPDMKPEFFTEGAQYMACWANWGYVTRSEDNRFYLTVGDHRGAGCQINIYEYVPARNLGHTVVDVDELLGWKENSYTDGKIHGNMGIMPDGTLWAATHYGVYPDSAWYANGYRGSWLLSYNIYTHEAKNWGVPLVGSNLPCFTLDAKRGRLMASGAFKMVMCWDTINKKVRFAGSPPNGWIMWQRAMLLDEETGKFWSVDNNEKPIRFMSFDPEYNKFERYEVSPPANPFDGNVALVRGHTESPAMDGWFYWSTWNGAFFRFKPEGPDGPVVESLGTNWDKGRDCLQKALDPTGRYVYYYPKQNSPIIQYDVKTGEKKVLCWLQDYYFEKYGYFMGQVYGMNISNDGSFLVFCMNGAFQGKGSAFGHPSLLVVEIPEEERPID